MFSDGLSGIFTQQFEQLPFAQNRHTQGIGFFQLTAGGFSGDDVVGFFGHAAGNFAACGFDQGLGLVAFEGGQRAG